MARRPASPTAMELLVRVLGAIGPYRDSVVLVGGFARDLYRHHEAFADPGLVGAETNDVDLATDDPLRLCGDQRNVPMTPSASSERYAQRADAAGTGWG